MALFLTLFPFYLFGNIHCLGMCGPLVMAITRHRFRFWYFFGRILSFSFTGGVAGEIGHIFHFFLAKFHIQVLTSFFFGSVIFFLGLFTLLQKEIPGQSLLNQCFKSSQQKLVGYMLKDSPWPTFLFGFFTVMLPCGQTLVVFSACALSSSFFVGLFNGFAFALLTSPALFLAMHIHMIFGDLKKHYNKILGICSIGIALLAFCRGFAELGLISHFVLNAHSASQFHLVIF